MRGRLKQRQEGIAAGRMERKKSARMGHSQRIWRDRRRRDERDLQLVRAWLNIRAQVLGIVREIR